MILFRRTFLAVLLLSTVKITFAQQHLANTLLWRISGNGVQKPSYLFGTMHLTDKRLFNFGDSVYSAIEKTDGLAIEVNPDEMAAYLINKMFDDVSGKKISEVLKEKDFIKDSAALSKKFNKPADEITASDVYKEKNKWVSDYMQKGEMPTFVDAYLYSIARKQGKWLGGVEDMADQAGLMDDIVDKSDVNYILADAKTDGSPAMERMINTYASQNLEEIQSLTEMSSPEMEDRIFIKRNIKMARRIDSLAAFRTMFFAVGAGHLPGDSGVINLLRARGFTVEPVMSDKKIAAANYKVKEVDVPWVNITDKQGMYTASMPGNPAPVKLLGLMDMNFLLDIISLSGYYTMAVPNPRDFVNIDSMFNNMAMAMFKTDKAVPAKKIVKDGIEGREFVHTADDYTMRVQLFYQNKVIYMAGMYTMKKDSVLSAGANRFFNSFTINKNYVAPTDTYTFADTVMGVRFEAPCKLEINKTFSNKKAADGWKITVFSGSDAASGAYIMLFTKEVSRGLYISSDSAVYNSILQSMQKQYANITSTDTLINGIKVIDSKGSGNVQNARLRMYNTILGNRNILLMAIADAQSINAPAIQKIFNSFTFINQSAASNWQYQYTADNTMATWSPSPLSAEVDKNQSLHHLAYDTTDATSYFVFTDTLGKYYWVDSDSLFWHEKQKAFTNEDSLISSTPTTNGTAGGMDMLVKTRNASDCFKRARFVVNGNFVYELVAYGGKDVLYSDNTDKFFADFKISAPVEKGFITTSKAAMLLNDLASKDSTANAEALGFFNEAPFTDKDIPLLHSALLKTYKSLYDSSENVFVNYRIVKKIAALQNAETVPFIKQYYNDTVNAPKDFKNIALALLAGMHTQESYNTLAQLIIQPNANLHLDYQVVNGLRDSLSLTASIYPTLLKLAGDTLYSGQIASVSLALIDSGVVSIDNMTVAQNDFINAAKNLLPSLKTNDDFNYYVYDIVSLLAKFKNPEAFTVLQQYLLVKNKFLKYNAAKLLLENNQPLSASVLLALAKDPVLRKRLYDDLKDMKKTSLFPTAYLTQQYFAESLMWAGASDDDDDDDSSPSAVVLVAKKTALFKNKNYTFYLYKVSFAGEDSTSSYLGVTGGYTIGSTIVEPKEEVTGVYYKESYDPLKIAQYLKAFLKRREDDNVDADEE